MKKVITTRFALPYSSSEDTFTPEDLYSRREIYHADLPRGVRIVTAAVDTQDSWLECHVYGWGIGEESWLIEIVRFEGSPVKKQLWDRCQLYLMRTYKHESGEQLGVKWTNVDAGGHFSSQVHDFCKTNEGNNIFAVRGSNDPKADILDGDVRINKATGAKHRRIGVTSCKNMLHGRLKIEKPEGGEPTPGYIHYPNATPLEFFKQILGEERDKRGKWTLIAGRRNEALDLYNYNLAALRMLRPDWEAIALGRAEDMGRRVHKPFNASKHVDESITVNPDYPIIVCCDFKKNPLIWILAQTDGRRVWVFEEFRIDSGDSVQMSMRVMRHYGGHKAGLIVYGSAQGSIRSSAGKSEYAILSGLGLGIRNVKRLDPPDVDRVNAINDMLENVAGEARLTIHPHCINLKRDFEQSLWLEDMTDMDRTDFGRGNAADALGHFIVYKWPLRSSRPNKGRTHWK